MPSKSDPELSSESSSYDSDGEATESPAPRQLVTHAPPPRTDKPQQRLVAYDSVPDFRHFIRGVVEKQYWLGMYIEIRLYSMAWRMHEFELCHILRPGPYQVQRFKDDTLSFWTTTAFKCSTRTVPIFLLESRDTPCVLFQGAEFLPQVLCEFVAKKWFRPYKSEIGGKRFFHKVIEPRGFVFDDETESLVATVTALQRNVCSQAEEMFENHASKHGYPDPAQLQPLFRSVSIVLLSGRFYAGYDNATDLSQAPALLIRTGEERGLSGPISFDSIADRLDEVYRPPGSNGGTGSDEKGPITAAWTTLGTAVDFVMGLEARETAAFGIQPDPDSIRGHESIIRNTAGAGMNKYPNWNQELPAGRPSTWVDTEVYTEWTGEGADEFRNKFHGKDAKLAEWVSRYGPRGRK